MTVLPMRYMAIPKILDSELALCSGLGAFEKAQRIPNTHHVMRNSETACLAMLSRFQELASTHCDGSRG